MDISTSFKNSKSISFGMPLDPNLCHNSNVGLQLNGGNMAKLQLLFIVTTKIKTPINPISNHPTKLDTSHHHHQLPMVTIMCFEQGKVPRKCLLNIGL